MVTKEIETELGTRILFLTHGGSIKVTHADNGFVRIDVASTDKLAPLATVEVFLDVREALALVEFLAIALKPGAGNQIITLNEKFSTNQDIRKPVNKSAFVRLHPNTPPSEIVALGKTAGISFDEKYVYNVRRKDKNRLKFLKTDQLDQLDLDQLDPLERRRRWLDATFGPLSKE